MEAGIYEMSWKERREGVREEEMYNCPGVLFSREPSLQIFLKAEYLQLG